MVPTITQPSGFGIDTIGAFLCRRPATVPNDSKGAVNALEAAFGDRKPRAAKLNPMVEVAPNSVQLCALNEPSECTASALGGRLPRVDERSLQAPGEWSFPYFSLPGISVSR